MNDSADGEMPLIDWDDAIVVFAKATRSRFGSNAMRRVQRGIDESLALGDNVGVHIWETVRRLIAEMAEESD